MNDLLDESSIYTRQDQDGQSYFLGRDDIFFPYDHHANPSLPTSPVYIIDIFRFFPHDHNLYFAHLSALLLKRQRYGPGQATQSCTISLGPTP